MVGAGADCAIIWLEGGVIRMNEHMVALELVKIWLSDNVTKAKALNSGEWKENVSSLYREALEVIRASASQKA